ncbi:Crp/Fnr family transcriptional regulator [Rhodocytophaga aerolata]|uniref:Crp/Fnr family transcriptional regulator n=2 Tax=Rhodocytophaga aerolata TaxID=455078 RepID=A0ABT8RDX9_9BACT|nr:Crp/Fnr family transcriptional regulator [Rhodocytophaga aerolata]
MALEGLAYHHQCVLNNVAQHTKLTSEEIRFFLSLLKLKKLRRKQFLVVMGEVSRVESFVTKGCLRAFTIDEKYEEHILQFAIEDWWISDFRSFLTGQPANQYIEALEETTVLQFSYEDLQKLYEQVPKFERFFRIKLQNAYMSFEHRVTTAISKSAEERYLDFTKRYAYLEQRVPLYMIASYLGFTPEFLSKIRKDLSNGG